MAWMMPLSHSTSDGQLEDLDGPSEAPGTRTVSMAWMMPLSHSTSDGQLEDLDGPSDLRPMMALLSQFLRNLRYAVRVPPLSVFWSVLRASIVFLPSITWYLSTSAVIGVPTSLLCLSMAELDGARSVYSPPERSMPSLESAAASWSKLS